MAIPSSLAAPVGGLPHALARTPRCLLGERKLNWRKLISSVELERELGRINIGLEFAGFHRLAGKRSRSSVQSPAQLSACDRADEIGCVKRLFDHDEVPRGSDSYVLRAQSLGQPDLVRAPATGTPTGVGCDHHAPHVR